MYDFWENIIKPPVNGRPIKPRSSGVSMLLDKGLSLSETRGLLETSALFIDFIKLSFGTIALYDPETLTRKINLAAKYGIPVYPGGTFLEIAFWEGTFDKCLQKLKDLSLEWIEISDGTIELDTQKRTSMIRTALTYGFKVITEAGKKDPSQQPKADDLIQTVLKDIDCGAAWVIIEARESGKSIGVYDPQGEIIPEKLDRLSHALPLSRIIWEAPLKSQQAALINRFGPGVNLGNIPPSEIMALEALRQGLRSDTWKKILN